MALRLSGNKSKEFLLGLPTESHTVLGTDSNMVCLIKRLPNEVKYICTSDKNQKIRFFTLSILDHCIDQIHILSGGRPITGSSHQLAFFDDVLKNPASNQNETTIYDSIYDRNSGEPFKVAFKKIQVNKLHNDSAKLKEFLNAIRNEILDFHSFQLFRQVINDVKRKTYETKVLLKESAENDKKLKELKYTIANQGRNCRHELHKVNKAYSIACDSVEQLIFRNMIEMRYAKGFENARFEQNEIKCERECRILQTIISKYRTKIILENRVHDEVLSFIKENQKELWDSIKVWINKYNLDMEYSHFECLQIKERLEEVTKYKDELKILFADHKKSIEDFKDYKEKKRIKDTEKQRLVDAATKIQAWWRGNMYRHQLGPYNPNKSKKGKGKNKKKAK